MDVNDKIDYLKNMNDRIYEQLAYAETKNRYNRCHCWRFHCRDPIMLLAGNIFLAYFSDIYGCFDCLYFFFFSCASNIKKHSKTKFIFLWGLS